MTREASAGQGRCILTAAKSRSRAGRADPACRRTVFLWRFVCEKQRRRKGRGADSVRRGSGQRVDLSKPDRMHARVDDATEQRMEKITCGIMMGKSTERAGKTPGQSRRGFERGQRVRRTHPPGAAEAFGDCRRGGRSPRGAREGADGGAGKRRTRRRGSAVGSANPFVPVWTR